MTEFKNNIQKIIMFLYMSNGLQERDMKTILFIISSKRIKYPKIKNDRKAYMLKTVRHF